MLDSIRSSAQSFGVKVAFGIIILVFVFWGIGNFNDRDYSNVVAVVNGEPIVASEFERAYLNAEEAIMRNNPGITRQQLEQNHLGRQVLRDMIQEVLLSQEATRAGIGVTPLELHNAVSKIPAFQDENGRFDPGAYQRFLDNGRIGVVQYEAGIRKDLLREKVLGLITAPVWVDPDEAHNRFNYLREQRVVDVIFLPASEWKDDIKVDDAEITAWYEDHKNNFNIPAMAGISYIIVKPDALVDQAALPEKDLRDWYEANKKNFEHPEQVKVRHILVEVPENAEDAEQKEALARLEEVKASLAAGKSFAEVADQFNGPQAAGPGGELGWIHRGETVPPFEEAAFAAEVGKPGEPVRSPFGWHIILVEERQEAGASSFAEAQEQVRAGLAHDMGMEKLSDALDTLIEDNILSRPLAESAAKFNLKDGRTGLMSQEDIAKTLGIKLEDAARLTGLSAGAPLDTALEGGDQYVIARIEEVTPAAVKPLEQVRKDVISNIKNEKAAEMAFKEATALLEQINKDETAALKQANRNLIAGLELARGGSIPGYQGNASLGQAIFETQPGKWLATPYTVKGPDGDGVLIGRIEKIVIPDQQEYEGMSELLQSALRRERMEDMYNLFIQQLADQAKIEITNPALIDRSQN